MAKHVAQATLAALRDLIYEAQTTKPNKLMPTNMPRKALQASALLGDKRAIQELQRMSDNLKWTSIVFLVVTGMTTAGFFSWQGCVSNTSKTEDRRMVETKAEINLKLKRLQEAAALRTRYVTSCKMTPDQAEAVVPDDDPPAPVIPVVK